MAIAPSTMHTAGDPLITFYGFPPGALTPADILIRTQAAEAALLRQMPETLQLLTILLNDVASIRTSALSVPKSTPKRTVKSTRQSTPKSTPRRRSREQSRAAVLSARQEHPDWSWQQLAEAVGLSRRYVIQLWKEGQER